MIIKKGNANAPMGVRLSHRYWLVLAISQLWPALASSADCDLTIATLVSVEGQIEVRDADGTTWHKAQPKETFCPGDAVKLGANSRAAIVLSNHTLVRLDALTTLTITGPHKEENFWVELIQGVTHFMSRVPRKLNVVTPFVNAVVEGTEFLVRVDETESFLSVFEGQVSLDNERGALSLASGQSAMARKAEAPVMQIVARPRDAVQWALYYPPVLQFDRLDFDDVSETAWQSQVTRSIELYQQGDIAKALATLEGLPDASVRHPHFFTYRASLRLAVGRVIAAGTDIDQALALNAEDGDALALNAIIKVVQNEKEQALALANRAVAAAPNSSGPLLARSYALQARFQLERARAAIETAVTVTPENALVWARLAELHLMFRDLNLALEAAQRATSINPNIAHTQMVLGYAQLIRINTKAAKQAFEKAIELDQAAPLQRLGLGLARIREGHLKEGRREIEIAATLDPDNALLRSYLGKAYYEEKRYPLAGEQYALARKFDPLDPTSYFYNAIRKQTANRPIEALQDVQKSIELNNNRAVYRSRLLLDEDQAARSVSLARIYNDLGFQQPALAEGWKSVTTDPANASAHRFLSDAYSTLPRHEIARVSELWQSQLLQPANAYHIQPQLAFTDLAIQEGAGPSSVSFNEFGPLFSGNRISLHTNGITGSNETWGNDLILSGVHDRFSFSLSQFHYETDGFRDNNDIEHDIYNVFAQSQLSPRSSILLEWRSKDTDRGDINLRFDPNDFSPRNRRNIETDFLRVGYRYTPTSRSDILVSASSVDATDQSFVESFSNYFLGFPIPVGQLQTEGDTTTDAESYNTEIQYIFRQDILNVITGAGRFHQDASQEGTITEIFLDVLFPVPPLISPIDEEWAVDHKNAYAYANISIGGTATWTVGVSYDDYEGRSNDADQFNPKLGVIWNPIPSTTLRLAAFRTLKRALLANQTLEPTQVSGFNQFFDDLNGSDTKRYGIAIDQILSNTLYGGIELTRRNLNMPRTPLPEGEDQKEFFHRAYLNWAPRPDIAVGTEYRFDTFETDVPRRERPCEMSTRTTPIWFNYFAPGGFFGGLDLVYVDQDVEFPVSEAADECKGSDVADDEDKFLVTNMEMGYRFPRRMGIASILVKNLFDEEFNFQDRNFQVTEPLAAQFIPERTVFLKLTLAL